MRTVRVLPPGAAAGSTPALGAADTTAAAPPIAVKPREHSVGYRLLPPRKRR
ncbi:hypothetical protein [Streptacidiphilus albus]|uniref:hypothetical protein n=1 Tax=Streptacidiphilus albus TaxID=105425 RepID=UPI000AD21687|nr:hypothetical protein [Streptacidiphilus albus]